MTVSKRCLLEVLLDVRGEQRRPRTGQCREYRVCSKTRDRQAPPKRDSRTDADTAPHPRISLVLTLPHSLPPSLSLLFLFLPFSLYLSGSPFVSRSLFRFQSGFHSSLFPPSVSRARELKEKRKIRLCISCASVYIYMAPLYPHVRDVPRFGHGGGGTTRRSKSYQWYLISRVPIRRLMSARVPLPASVHDVFDVDQKVCESPPPPPRFSCHCTAPPPEHRSLPLSLHLAPFLFLSFPLFHFFHSPRSLSFSLYTCKV